MGTDSNLLAHLAQIAAETKHPVVITINRHHYWEGGEAKNVITVGLLAPGLDEFANHKGMGQVSGTVINMDADIETGTSELLGQLVQRCRSLLKTFTVTLENPGLHIVPMPSDSRKVAPE